MSNLGGGSLLVAWQLKDKHVLIVGGGEVASGRIESILVADAHITLLCPREGLHSRTKRFIDQCADRITYHDRRFAGPEELHTVDMVLTAIDDVNSSREIYALCREAKIPVNVADIPDACDFYFGSQVRDGPLQIMISTNGQSPKMSAMIREKIEKSLSGSEGEAIQKAGVLRAQLKERAPGVGGPIGRRRMRWMIDICNAWEMEDFTLLDDEMIKRLLDDGWEKSRVPTLEEVGGKRSTTSKNLQVAQNSPNSLLPSAVGFVTGVICTTLMFISWRR